jgi:nitrite reductase/ring-hydroxylating ferredoxin subunit
MLTEAQNERICRVGLGTPGGEYLRRYWQPVGISARIRSGGQPQHVRVLGEDLVLFRDDQGRPGLLGMHCSHRLTSLAYGRVEDGGIRCPFHGWLYDVTGRCLEQPAEPDGSGFEEKIHHLAYPCQELGGLVFAYMGPPDKMPLLPRYEALAREDGTRAVDTYEINSNYLQNLEGNLDIAHASFLHVTNWSKVKHRLATLPKPDLEFAETEYGIWQKAFMPNPETDTTEILYTHFIMPAGCIRIHSPVYPDGKWPEAMVEGGEVHKFQSWCVPVDDEHSRRFMVSFAPLGPGGKRHEWPEPAPGPAPQPGPANDYFRDYDGVDSISGIPVTAPGIAIKRFHAQDSMVMELQGEIVDRSREHLAASDRLLAAMRRMMLKGIGDVEQDRDPKHLIRDPAQNSLVYIRGIEQFERV